MEKWDYYSANLLFSFHNPSFKSLKEILYQNLAHFSIFCNFERRFFRFFIGQYKAHSLTLFYPCSFLLI